MVWSTSSSTNHICCRNRWSFTDFCGLGNRSISPVWRVAYGWQEDWGVGHSSTLPPFRSQWSPSTTKKGVSWASPLAAKTFLVVLTLPLYLFAFTFYLAIAHRVLNQQGVPLSNPRTNIDKGTRVRSKRTFMTEMGSKRSYQCFKPVL